MSILDRLRGQKEQQPATPTTIRCPECGEENPADAMICQGCRSALPRKEATQKTAR